MGLQLKMVKTCGHIMAEKVAILTPVIISMCQLMANDSSYSSIVQRPGGRREKMEQYLHVIKGILCRKKEKNLKTYNL